MRETRDYTADTIPNKTFRESQSCRKSFEDPKDSCARGPVTFQIRTAMDGFNSGRIYYIQARSAEACAAVVGTLQRLVAAARSRAEKASRFRKTQRHLRAVYESTPFQITSSMLILMAIPPPPIALRARNEGEIARVCDQAKAWRRPAALEPNTGGGCNGGMRRRSMPA